MTWITPKYLCQYSDHIDLGFGFGWFVLLVIKGLPAFFSPKKKAAKKTASGFPVE